MVFALELLFSSCITQMCQLTPTADVMEEDDWTDVAIDILESELFMPKLRPGRVYSIRVVPKNNQGLGATSPHISVTTPTGVCKPPPGLNVFKTGPVGTSLIWSSVPEVGGGDEGW